MTVAFTCSDALSDIDVCPPAVPVTTEGTNQVVELRLLDARSEPFVAKGEAPDHRTALDRAEEKLRRQLEKANGKPRRSRPSGVATLVIRTSVLGGRLA